MKSNCRSQNHQILYFFSVILLKLYPIGVTKISRSVFLKLYKKIAKFSLPFISIFTSVLANQTVVVGDKESRLLFENSIKITISNIISAASTQYLSVLP